MQSKDKQKRQFKGTSKPRLFFDRDVRQTGFTKSISLGKVIPDGWNRVRVQVIDRDEYAVVVKFSRLVEVNPNACDTSVNKGCEQDS